MVKQVPFNRYVRIFGFKLLDDIFERLLWRGAAAAPAERARLRVRVLQLQHQGGDVLARVSLLHGGLQRVQYLRPRQPGRPAPVFPQLFLQLPNVERAVLVQVNVADDRMRLWRQTEGLATVGGCR